MRWQRRWPTRSWLLVAWDATQVHGWRFRRTSEGWALASQTSVDREADLVGALKRCAHQLRATHLPVVTLFPGVETIVRRIALPPQVSPAQVEALMPYELPRHLPLDPEAFVCDTVITGRGRDQTWVLLVAVRRESFEQHLEIVQRARLRVRRVLPSMLAFAASLSPQPGHWGALQVYRTHADIVMFRGAEIMHARSFEIHTSSVARELQGTVNLYLRQQGLESLDHCLCLSDPHLSEQEDVAAILRELPIGTVQRLAQEHPRFAGAWDAPYDLRRPIARERRQARQQRLRRWSVQGAPLVASLVLLAGFWGLTEIDRRYEARAMRTAYQKETLLQQRRRIPPMQKQLAQLQDRRNVFRWVEERYPSLAERLYEVARHLPETIWLEQIRMPQEAHSRRERLRRPLVVSQLEVIGYAAHQAEVDAFVQALQERDCFRRVRQSESELKFVKGQRRLRFTLLLESPRLDAEGDGS